MTFEEAIIGVLQADALLTTTGTLGKLCGYNATTKPDIVLHDFPPERPATPFITYSVSAEMGHFPRTVFIDIKAWGNNYRAIHNRIYDLLHKKLELSATDWAIKGISFESAGPVLWDDALKVFFQRARYWTKVLKV